MPSLVQKLLLFSGGAAFSPLNISGLVSWYDASDTSTLWEDSARTTPAADNADVIGAWDDKSGNGYHATQATTINKPTLRTNVQNGKNAIRFDGSDDFLQNTSYPDFGDNYSIYIVGKSEITADVEQGFFEVSTGAVNTGFSLMHETVLNFRGRDASTIRNISGGDIRDGAFRLISGVNTGSQLRITVNGGAASTATYTAPNPNTLNQLKIGGLIAGSFALLGDIAELLIYTGSHTDDQQASIKAYLNTKWAVY